MSPGCTSTVLGLSGFHQCQNIPKYRLQGVGCQTAGWCCVIKENGDCESPRLWMEYVLRGIHYRPTERRRRQSNSHICTMTLFVGECVSALDYQLALPFSSSVSRAKEKIINEPRNKLAAKQSHSWFLASNLFMWPAAVCLCCPQMHTCAVVFKGLAFILSRERKPLISRTLKSKPVSQTQAAASHS